MTRVSLVWLAVLAVAVTSARADVNPLWSDEQLAGFSAAIVIGRVSDLATGRDIVTGAIHTYVTVAVGSVLKGDISERVIVVKQLGGRLGNEQASVFGQAEFVDGEDVLLFLDVRPRDKTLYTTALWQGKWSIEREATTGERIATRRNPDSQERGILRGDAERRVLSTLSSRLSALPAAPSGAVVGKRPFVVEPSAEEMKDVVRSPKDELPFTQLGPYRWNEFDTHTTIFVDAQAGGQPGLAGGGANELTNAAGVWTGATGLSLAGGGTTSRCLFASPADGRISILFNDPCGDISNSGGIIAVGGARYFLSGTTVNGVAFGRVVAGYYVTNDASDVLNLLHNSGCFQFVATHELGHVLGMGHSTDPTAIMYPSVSFQTCSSGSPKPSADDLAGIRFIYVNGTPGLTAPGAPTGFTATASASTANLAWTTPTTGGTPTAYMIEAGSVSGGLTLANFSTGSTATTYSAPGVGAGVFYLRVKATNSAGTSAASNQATMVVGGGCAAAPGAPTGFAISGNSGGTVAFTWSAASGSPTSYLIEAGSTSGAANLVPGSDLGGTATSYTATGVARGTYFVRLRAKNPCGTSGVSNEVVLVVP